MPGDLKNKAVLMSKIISITILNLHLHPHSMIIPHHHKDEKIYVAISENTQKYDFNKLSRQKWTKITYIFF